MVNHLKYQFKVKVYLVLYLLALDLDRLEVFWVCLGPMKEWLMQEVRWRRVHWITPVGLRLHRTGNNKLR